MKAPALYLCLSVALGLVFLLLPGVDLDVSEWFYVSGQGFPLADWLPLRIFERTIPWLTRLIILVCIAGAVWLALRGRPLWRLDRRALIFIVLATAIGPGLIANTLLKDHWGRARPNQVAEFGGSREFTPAPFPAVQCERNCSFVSGHAALGFSLASFALLLPAGRRRRGAIAAALGFGALVGLGRVATGHHFLSDVIYAGLIVFATSWLLHEAIVVHDLFGRWLRWMRDMGDGFGWRSPAARIALWTGAVVLFEIASILWLDRPVATYFHEHGEPWRPVCELIQRIGIGTPYVVLFAALFVGLRWGGHLPPFRGWATGMRAAAPVAAFLFAAVAASGLAVDLLKVIFGRARPKLFFAAGIYDFAWLGFGSSYWSFPSGHAATAGAIMTALWCLWPRHLLFYIALAMVVATSRVVMGAHYLSDVIMGAFVAVLLTRGLATLFAHFQALPVYSRPARRAVLPPP